MRPALCRVGPGHRDSKWTAWNEPHVSTFRCHRQHSGIDKSIQNRPAALDIETDRWDAFPSGSFKAGVARKSFCTRMTSASICVRVKVMSASDCDDTCHASNDCAARGNSHGSANRSGRCPWLAIQATLGAIGVSVSCGAGVGGRCAPVRSPNQVDGRKCLRTSPNGSTACR